MIGVCQAPYQKWLSRHPRQRGGKLDMLWNRATLMQTYQAEVQPVAPQLATLATAWSALRLRNPAMNRFVHAMAAEFLASLDAPVFDSCGFVKAMTAHHYSYAWARQSSYGVQSEEWWNTISQAGNRTGPFWRYVYPTGPGGPPSPKPAAHLFTIRELSVLANLPGEIG